MRLNIRYFASVREALGTSQEAVELPDDIRTAAAARDWLCQRGPAWAEALSATRAIRMAFNQVMCEPGQALAEGGELAFFPPVTGG